MGGQSQERMAGTSTNVYKFDNVVRGHYIYKTLQTPHIDEALQEVWKDANKHDEYADCSYQYAKEVSNTLLSTY